jgi:DNA (cytosine-5)-methyltransferase 1
MRAPAAEIAAVDVFCGAAGLSLGLKNSGIAIAGGIDVDPACRHPFETNIGSPFLQQDVTTLSGATIVEMFGDAKIKVLAGCAPCQPFSGYTTKRRNIDSRWELLIHFLRLVREAGPDIVTLENVPRLSHLPLWDEFVASLRALGFHVAWEILDVAKYGVPQNRKRLVLLGSKLGPIALSKALKGRTPTVMKAIGKLPAIGAGVKNEIDPLHSSRALTPRNLARIRRSKPAGTWREWPASMRADCHKTASGKTYPSVYGRMSWDKPAPTIQCRPIVIHAAGQALCLQRALNSSTVVDRCSGEQSACA